MLFRLFQQGVVRVLQFFQQTRFFKSLDGSGKTLFYNALSGLVHGFDKFAQKDRFGWRNLDKMPTASVASLGARRGLSVSGCGLFAHLGHDAAQAHHLKSQVHKAMRTVGCFDQGFDAAFGQLQPDWMSCHFYVSHGVYWKESDSSACLILVDRSLRENGFCMKPQHPRSMISFAFPLML